MAKVIIWLPYLYLKWIIERTTLSKILIIHLSLTILILEPHPKATYLHREKGFRAIAEIPSFQRILKTYLSGMAATTGTEK
jgi:hypothetical protein